MEQVCVNLAEIDGVDEHFWIDSCTDFTSLKRQAVRAAAHKQYLDRSRADEDLWELVDKRGEEWPLHGSVSQHLAARPSREMRVIRLKPSSTVKRLHTRAGSTFSGLGHSITAFHELWYTFSSYSLRSSISSPNELALKQFQIFCNHCGFPGLSAADLGVHFKAKARKGCLTFSAFLDVMRDISHVLHPRLPLSEAMSCVIRRYVAPHSKSWSYAPNKPVFKNHSAILGLPRVQRLLEEKMTLIEPLFLSFANSKRSANPACRDKQGLQQVMRYSRFLAFVSHFRLSKLGISSVMLSEVFLSCSSFLAGDKATRSEREFTMITLTDFVVVLSRIALLLVPPQVDEHSSKTAVNALEDFLEAIYLNGFVATDSFRFMCAKLESLGWSNRYHFVTAADRFKLYFLNRRVNKVGIAKDLGKGRAVLTQTNGHSLDASSSIPCHQKQTANRLSDLDLADIEFERACEMCVSLAGGGEGAFDVEQVSSLFNAANTKYVRALRVSDLEPKVVDGIKVRWSSSILSAAIRTLFAFNLSFDDTRMYATIWLHPIPFTADRLLTSKVFRVCDLLRAYLQQSASRLEEVLGLTLAEERMELSFPHSVLKEYAKLLECTAGLHVVLFKLRLRLLVASENASVSVSLGQKVMHDAFTSVSAVLETLDNLHPYLVKQGKMKLSTYTFWSKILFERGFVQLLKLACANAVSHGPYLSRTDAKRYKASADLFFAHSRLLSEYTCEHDPSPQPTQQAARLWVWECLVDKEAVATDFLKSSMSFCSAAAVHLTDDIMLSRRETMNELVSRKAQAVFEQLFQAYNKSGSGQLRAAELDVFESELSSSMSSELDPISKEHLSPLGFQSYLLWIALTQPEGFLVYLSRVHWHKKIATYLPKLSPIQKQLETFSSDQTTQLKTGGVEAMYEILLRSYPVVNVNEVRQRFHVDLSEDTIQMEKLTDKDHQQLDPVTPEACLVDYFVVVGAGDVQARTNSDKSFEAEAEGDAADDPNDAHFSPEIVSVWPPADGHVDSTKEFSDVEQLQFALMQQQEPFPEDLPMFCFPYGLRLYITTDAMPPESYSFTIVLTDTSGRQRYGTCFVFYEEMSMRGLASAIKRGGQQIPSWVYERTSSKANELRSHIYAPTCLCILSRWPFHDAFKSCLSHLHQMSKRSSPIPIERYIKRLLYETPVPPKGTTQVQMCIGDAAVYFSRVATRLTSRDGLCSLLRRLNIDNVLFVIAALLQEKKVALCTCNIGLLTPLAEALMSLLFPFQPQCVYIPVLPEPLYDFLFAPVPFLMGVHSSYLPRTSLVSTPASSVEIIQPPLPETDTSSLSFAVSPKLQPSDVLFVDLDNDRLVVPSSSLETVTLLPEVCRKKVVSKLRKAQATVRVGSLRLGVEKSAGVAAKTKLKLKKQEAMEARKRDVYVNPLSAMTHKGEQRRLLEQTSEEISTVFAQMFVTMLLQYRKYLDIYPHREEQDLTTIFDVQGFLQHHPAYATFFSQMIDTQMFHHFIHTSSKVNQHCPNIQLFHELLNSRQSKIKAMAIVRSRFALSKDFLNEIRETYFVPNDVTRSTGPMWTYRKFPVLDPEKLRNFGASKNHIIPIVKVQADASLVAKKKNGESRLRTSTSREFAAIIEATTSRISKRKHNDMLTEPSLAETICREIVETVIYEAEIEALHQTLANLSHIQ